jgi:hypothetical protein
MGQNQRDAKGRLIMKRSQTRRSQPSDSFEILTQVGDKLRAQYGEVRYVETVFHNGSQWTVKADWERLDGEAWRVVELGVENY